ncbi:unnamed protein product [Rangifer tarandus platyrhynchus]|uniref:Uncharacterized protein n=1 Tax=Rangifer tarandus platyrhynchus TaxID=3082113 RepID=A0ACB1MJZ4_RANTA
MHTQGKCTDTHVYRIELWLRAHSVVWRSELASSVCLWPLVNAHAAGTGGVFPNLRMPLSLYHPQAALCYPDIKKQVLPFLISLKGRTLQDLIDGGSSSIYNPPIF